MDTYVILKNIELYKELLETEALDQPKRLIIEQLLAEEELKLQRLLNAKDG